MTTPTTQLALDTLRLEQRGRVLIVRIDAPPHNYMTAGMQQDFLAVLTAVESDTSIGAVVVTGLPHDRFITHYDVDALAAAAADAPASLSRAAASAVVRGAGRAGSVRGLNAALEHSPAAGVLNVTRAHQLVLGIARSPAVWIAAIHGLCAGGGLEMAGYFDMRIATRDAQLMLPELLIGLTTTFGAQRLVELVGPGRALEMMLEGRPYTAEEAHRMGLLNEVVETRDDLLDAALSRAHRYARRPRATVAAQKRILTDATHVSATESLRREGIAQIMGIGSPATQAALVRWHEMYTEEGSGDSVFVTNPDPWIDGTALDFAALPPKH
ncbi:MAG: enoyl-CoA hydratase/isomerase family protein [Mycobacteriaceae bacterium]